VLAAGDKEFRFRGPYYPPIFPRMGLEGWRRELAARGPAVPDRTEVEPYEPPLVQPAKRKKKKKQQRELKLRLRW
jgi:hypothetical protein